jgi:hypothetical protein
VRQLPLFITALLLSHLSFGQTQDIWVRFYDTTTEQSGYKDLKGNITIPAKIKAYTRADSFYNIIAVYEKADSLYKSYYMLKDGRRVGQDSVFMFDFTVDCESEGKIIFYDKKKDRVGFFDKNGIAIIPAIYNYVTPFRNGIAIAHRNAKRKCWEEGGDTTNCEHLGWEGGEMILINDKNEVLADSLNIDLSSINWYSKKENTSSIDTSIYVSIKGRDNITYSFIDFDKEFKKWFGKTFIPTIRSKNGTLKNLLFAEITYSSTKNGWTSLDKNEFLKLFPYALTSARFQTSKLKELSISEETTSSFMTESKLFTKYYDACGEHNRYRFPAFDVMMTYYKKRLKPLSDIQSGFYKDYEINYQEHFLFLRTEEGYKLLQVSLKK